MLPTTMLPRGASMVLLCICRSVYHLRWVSATCELQSKAAEAIPQPQPDGELKEYSDKIKKLVEGISSFTLSETAQLSELLKVIISPNTC